MSVLSSMAASDFGRCLRMGVTGSTEAAAKSGRRTCDDNLRRLQLDSPALAAEGVWCHPLPRPEQGGLLIATSRASEVLGDVKYEQLVALLVEHGERGSIALVLNRPTGMVMGKRPNGMPFQLTVR